MRAREAKTEFENFLSRRGLALASMTPSAALDAMTAFYRDVRADDCDMRADGDMLLCEWGTHDWGAGPRFEFDVTRQLSPGAEDEDIWQLRLCLRFAPDDGLRALGSGNRWCESLEGLADFEDFVRASPAYRSVGRRSDAETALDYDCAG